MEDQEEKRGRLHSRVGEQVGMAGGMAALALLPIGSSASLPVDHEATGMLLKLLPTIAVTTACATRDLLVRPQDHWLAQDGHQRLAGEARRLVPRRQHANHSPPLPQLLLQHSHEERGAH
jgi:hypothetical protein